MAPEKLFLTELDHHFSKNLSLRPSALRAYVMQQSLFFDRLIVGDSQFNNNKSLRALVWRDEPAEIDSSVPRDLDMLVEHKYLIPALRTECKSLRELRDEQAQRNVGNLPSDGFLDFMRERLSDTVERYDLTRVGARFRHRVLETFKKDTVVRRGVTREVADRVYAYAQSNDPLNFNDILVWLNYQVERQTLEERHSRRVFRMVAECYCDNVPAIMDICQDVLITRSRVSSPREVMFGRPPATEKQNVDIHRYKLPPTVLLNWSVLAQMPARVLEAIKDPRGPYKAVAKALAHYRQRGTMTSSERENFAGSLEAYLREADVIASQEMNPDFRENFRDWQRKVEKKNWRTVVECAFGHALTLIAIMPAANDGQPITPLAGLIASATAIFIGAGGIWRVGQRVRGNDIKIALINGKPQCERLVKDISK